MGETTNSVSASDRFEGMRLIFTSGATSFRWDDVIEALRTTGTWFSL